MIHHTLQITNNEYTRYLMPRATHVVENVHVVQPLILRLPLSIKVVYDLPQLLQKCP